MTTKDIAVDTFKQEFVPYKEPSWQHSMLYTILSETHLKYIPLHWHTELQFTIVEQGKIDLIVNGKHHSLTKGDGMFINSGVIHEIHPTTHDATFICWNIGADMFDDYIQKTYIQPLIRNQHLPFVILKPENNAQKILIQAVKAVYFAFHVREKGFELIITREYLLVLHQMVTEISMKHHDQHVIYDPRVKRILEYIHEHYQHQISLEKLADITFLSRSETIRLFKRHIGRTPISYILNYRLDHSVVYLINTRSTISEIALQCGFSSVSYYIKKFREHYHVTPRTYRQINKDH